MPTSVACVIEVAMGWPAWTKAAGWRRMARSSSAGSMRPSAPSTGDRRAPPVKYSGAPHSSSSMCASRWAKATPPGLASAVIDSELAAVPVATK